jgi:hypothetical protein
MVVDYKPASADINPEDSPVKQLMTRYKKALVEVVMTEYLMKLQLLVYKNLLVDYKQVLFLTLQDGQI